MMDLLRRSISGWAGRIFFGLLLFVFAIAWAVADGFSGASSPSTVLSAGKTRVEIQDYQIAYQQTLNRVSQQLGRRLTPEEAAAFGIDQQVLAQLGTGALLDEQGRQLGLGLSDEGIVRIIAGNPAFQDAAGNFSRPTFRAVLQNAGMSEEGYLRRLESESPRTQIVEAVSQGVSAPQAISTALGLYAGERRTVDYLTLAPTPASEIADPSDEQVAAFFEENRDDYAQPELRAVSLAVLSPQDRAEPQAVEAEAIAAEYEEQRARFTTPERRRIEQIVFADQAAADAALAELQGGASFEDVATAAGRTPADLSLGLLTRAEIPDTAIAEAAFSTAEGEPSGVVPGVFGPAILRVTEIVPEAVRPLAEVSEEIRNEIALDRAADAASAGYDAFEAARGRGATFEEAAGEAGLTVRTLPAVDAQGNDGDGQFIDDLPAGDDLLDAIFASDPGFDNAPVDAGDGGFVFYDVTEVIPARSRELDEVRERVVEDWKASEAQQLTEERAEALKARVEGGESLADVATAESLEVRTASSITRQTGAGEIGPGAASAAFAGPQGSVATAAGPNQGEQLVLVVREVAPPADPMANVPRGQMQQASAALGNDLVQGYVEQLQGSYSIDYNERAIQQIQGTSQ